MLKYCLDRYKTQEMCYKTVNAFLVTLQFVPDWFVASKVNKKIDDDLFSNDDIIFVNEDFNYVTFLSDEMGILSVDIDDINLDDVSFDKDDPETLIHVRLTAWCNDINNANLVKRYQPRINACSMASNKVRKKEQN